MKRVLLLGKTGFIGSNIEVCLRKQCIITAPARDELDLLNTNAVRAYINNRKFDVVVHLANPTGHNAVDKEDEIFERSLRVFTSLLHCNELYEKMIYIGSGAEYGKHRAIVNARECEFGQELPCDSYGLSRYIMSELAEKSKNIYNLRVFGCYGIGDPLHKLIPFIISCIRKDKPIALRQNTVFDFLYVKDIAPVIMHFIENEPEHKVYNLCSGEPILIGSIAEKIRCQMNSNVPISFKKEGYGLEYTGNNERLRLEKQNWCPRLIDEGIKEIIDCENWEY